MMKFGSLFISISLRSGCNDATIDQSLHKQTNTNRLPDTALRAQAFYEATR